MGSFSWANINTCTRAGATTRTVHVENLLDVVTVDLVGFGVRYVTRKVIISVNAEKSYD